MESCGMLELVGDISVTQGELSVTDLFSFCFGHC